MVSTWMGDHSSVKVDAVGKNTVKSQEWINGASNKNSWGQKKKIKFPSPSPSINIPWHCFPLDCPFNDDYWPSCPWSLFAVWPAWSWSWSPPSAPASSPQPCTPAAQPSNVRQVQMGPFSAFYFHIFCILPSFIQKTVVRSLRRRLLLFL